MAQTDGVEVFEERAANLGWTFSYGNKANQNLLQSDLIADKIYLLLDPVRRVRSFSEFGGTGITTFTGNFLLLIKSTIDQMYYGDQGGEVYKDMYEKRVVEDGGTLNSISCVNSLFPTITNRGKYKENIKPLLQTEIVKLENLLNCEDYRINEWAIVDIIDIFDFNADGIVVTYNISIL
jgi:hypothetical protein